MMKFIEALQNTTIKYNSSKDKIEQKQAREIKRDSVESLVEYLSTLEGVTVSTSKGNALMSIMTENDTITLELKVVVKNLV